MKKCYILNRALPVDLYANDFVCYEKSVKVLGRALMEFVSFEAMFGD